MRRSADLTFEAIDAEGESSLRCMHRVCLDFADDHPWHYHPEYEITWIIRSEGVQFVGDSIERYHPGDLIITGPNLPHCWRNEWLASGQGAAEWIVVQFDPAAFGDRLLDLPEARGVKGLLHDAARGLHFRQADVPDVGALMRGMVAPSGMGRLTKLLDLLDLLAARVRPEPLTGPEYAERDGGRAALRQLDLVHRYIREHLPDGEICQAEVAEMIGMSASTFSRFFRSVSGQTFVGFVKALRVRTACRLLLGDARITDVAMECGYRHISNFNRQFFEIKGMTPTEYRRRVQFARNDPSARAALRIAS